MSVESLQALRDVREASERGRRSVRGSHAAESAAEDLFLEIANRLEIRAAEVGELRVRLELAERARNILEEERRSLADDLERERERVEQLEQEYLAAQRETERLEAELGEARHEVEQLRAEVEQGKGFFRRRFSGG